MFTEPKTIIYVTNDIIQEAIHKSILHPIAIALKQIGRRKRYRVKIYFDSILITYRATTVEYKPTEALSKWICDYQDHYGLNTKPISVIFDSETQTADMAYLRQRRHDRSDKGAMIFKAVRYYSGYIVDEIEAANETEALKKAQELPVRNDELQDLEETDIEISKMTDLA